MRTVVVHKPTVLGLIFILCASVVMLITDAAVAADLPREVWTRQFGTTEGDRGWGVAADDSAVYVAGDTSGTFDGQTPAGGPDAWVRKYDADGSEVWTRQFGTTGADDAQGVAVDSTGVYVAGSTDDVLPGQINVGARDVFIRKYDTHGTEVWTRQFGTTGGDDARGVAVDSTGVYITGNTNGTLPGQSTSGSTDVFVRKYDTDGNEVWTRQFGASLDTSGWGIAVNATGVYVTGEANGAFPGQTPAGWWDAWVRKYDTDGNEVWTRQFGTDTRDRGFGVAVDPTGVYITGNTWGAFPGHTNPEYPDVFVRKYDTDGNEAWTDQFGTVIHDNSGGVAADGTGVYVTGLFAWGTSAFMREYDPDGNEVWTDEFGTDASTEGHAVAADGSGGVYVTGGVGGALPGQTPAGKEDAFVRKYDRSPVLCLGEVATIVGTADADTLRGTPGDDVIHGRGSHDTINGMGGDDVICGGEGSDTLYGKAGDDRLDGGTGYDKLNGGAGNDVLIGGLAKDTVVYFGASAGVTVDLAAGTGGGADQGNDTISGVEHVMGSLHGDVLVGNRRGNRLKGLTGRDELRGRGGDDTLIGAGNNDSIYGGHGNDQLLGNNGHDRLFGGAGDDMLKGGLGNDELRGGVGVDHLYGGPGVADACYDGEIYVSCELPL